jgi:glutathione synthase/RimK-type ligase-like ATP-grasp enzyme
MALANAGFAVEAVCPSRHSLLTLSCVEKAFTHYGFSPANSFETAILASEPDLIVPCDDVAVRHLHQLYDRAERRKLNSLVCALIERSLGSPKSLAFLYQRADFLHAAKEEGIRVPPTQVIATLGDLEEWAGTAGFPMVLKADSTSGGEGVRIVHNQEEAEQAFKSLSAPPLVARAVKRALLDQDSSLIAQSFLRRRATISAQAFIRGREGTSTVACWKGTVLASLHFEVVNKANFTGHSTVLRLIENAEMCTATEKIVQRFSLSGVIGFDFMLDAETGNPYLIEINARATQVGHLTLGPGRDLPSAIFSAVTGRSIHEAPKVTDNKVIALFPQEWKRDPSSPYLRSGHHDVPWDEPELIRACVRHQRKQWAWYAEQETLRSLAPVRSPRC